MQSLLNYITAERDSVVGIIVLGALGGIVGAGFLKLGHFILKQISARYRNFMSAYYYSHGYLMGHLSNEQNTLAIVSYFSLQMCLVMLISLLLSGFVALATAIFVSSTTATMWPPLLLSFAVLFGFLLYHRMKVVYLCFRKVSGPMREAGLKAWAKKMRKEDSATPDNGSPRESI